MKPSYLATYRAVTYAPSSNDDVQFGPSASIWIVPGTDLEMDVASTNLRRYVYDGSGE